MIEDDDKHSSNNTAEQSSKPDTISVAGSHPVMVRVRAADHERLQAVAHWHPFYSRARVAQALVEMGLETITPEVLEAHLRARTGRPAAE
jgi:hypothetical protein